MKRLIAFLIACWLALLPVALEASLVPTTHATHDNGLGKSNDHDPNNEKDMGDIAVAPEPETYWLFLMGVLVMFGYFRASGGSIKGGR
jgi:hypothetical protein